MACGVDGTVGVSLVCSAQRNAKLTFEYRLFADGEQPGALDASHKGPCAVYMKNTASAISDKATGDGWFKIWDEGYDSAAGKWCTEKVIANGGLLSVKVPDDLAGGNYLVRSELLALQEADKTPANPQFYVGCAQIFLQSTATTLPKDTVSIPGYVTIKDPSVLFSIYTPKFPYTTPGPAAYQPGVSASKQVTAVTQQTEGLRPASALLVNANWVGTEVSSYSTESGCNTAAEACWNQANTCYSTAPPTGSANCKIWEAKCQGIRNACDASSFSGPPNVGKKLAPVAAKVVVIPAAVNEGTSGTSSSSSVTSSISASPSVEAVTKYAPVSNPVSRISSAASFASAFPKMELRAFQPAGSVSAIPSVVYTTIQQATIVIIPSSTVTNTVFTSTTLSTFLVGQPLPTGWTDPILNAPLAFTAKDSSSMLTPLQTSSVAAAPASTPTSAPDSHPDTDKVALCGEGEGKCEGEIKDLFGSCCSAAGWCGRTADHCGTGCQPGFGECKKVKRGGRWISR